ncbi:alpha-D-ribose 1-methylphosphonate 5-triphosphate diphosphatase [Rhodophyticola porphyridii]|uniref:Alpha-D-ribose 1-methylphosphonate 5-triphosphate diphosphatase n=1 Tax=Rhodophyticola porphyridii TaxID=1852017 RepID=A0A3L9Y5K1_9RHOB|nr:alpha-D-ribose 1-methylphosphonate 5-triphosphate diphosphatase [Rhodophyticola porphyridii]RMA43672.1 alpha-D-ribose 1-methylphosphonate 5-triphosphate diphosphatase [Rhodophyticola porphyridii]
MFDASADRPLLISNATVVTPTGCVTGGVAVETGKIADIGPGITGGFDLSGQILIPGIVDLHTDHVETHIHPRSHVQWAFLPALMAHDAVVISGGTTTVFDSLSVGASMQRPERRTILGPLIDALEHGQREGMFRADHFLHMRCEVSDPTTIALVDANITRDIAHLISVMDHTPGDRQSPNIEKWFWHMVRDMEVSEAEGRERMAELLERSARFGPKVRSHVVSAAQRHDIPLMAHDDRTLAHVDQAQAEGVTISEFPTTIEAARRARSHGQTVVAGAPNYLRGGSQSGNVAVRELLAEGLVDVLASDYVPRSPLDAAFAIASDPALPYDLPQTVAMVTDAPARVAGLTDRGRIEKGLRADLVAIRLVGHQPQVSAVWRAGQRVF